MRNLVFVIAATFTLGSCSQSQDHGKISELLDKATALERQGKFSDASMMLEEILGLNGRHEQALLRLANLYLRLDLPSKAEPLYRRLLDLNEENAEAHNNLGLLLGRKGKLAEAVLHFEKAIEAQPGLAGPHYNLGHTLFLQGDFPQAESHMRKALNIVPDHKQYLEGLGLLYKTTGQVGKAVSIFSELVQIDGQTPIHRSHLATALADNGQYDEAVFHLRKYMELTDDRAEKTIARNKIFEINRLRSKARHQKTILP